MLWQKAALPVGDVERSNVSRTVNHREEMPDAQRTACRPGVAVAAYCYLCGRRACMKAAIAVAAARGVDQGMPCAGPS